MLVCDKRYTTESASIILGGSSAGKSTVCELLGLTMHENAISNAAKNETIETDKKYASFKEFFYKNRHFLFEKILDLMKHYTDIVSIHADACGIELSSEQVAALELLKSFFKFIEDLGMTNEAEEYNQILANLPTKKKQFVEFPKQYVDIFQPLLLQLDRLNKSLYEAHNQSDTEKMCAANVIQKVDRICETWQEMGKEKVLESINKSNCRYWLTFFADLSSCNEKRISCKIYNDLASDSRYFVVDVSPRILASFVHAYNNTYTYLSMYTVFCEE